MMTSDFVSFINKADELKLSNPARGFDVVCFSIENYEYLHAIYGETMCKKMLAMVENSILDSGIKALCSMEKRGIIYALWHADLDYNKIEKIREKFNLLQMPRLCIKIGVCRSVDTPVNFKEMCDNAFLATVNQNAQSLYCQYKSILREELAFERIVIDGFRQGIKAHEFEVLFQPKIELLTGKVTGAEALVRWHQPQMGIIQPGQFIPILEKNGYIKALDLYMVEEVCSYQMNWITDKKKILPVSVNLSRMDFDDGALDHNICSIVDGMGLQHEMINFEITESAFIGDNIRMIEMINRISNRGFRMELDDFGSGYSQLNALGDLPCNTIKLDRNLIKGLNNQKKRTILEHIVNMLRDLGAETVAEGIETVWELKLLAKMGCNIGQGYYFDRPLKASDFAKKYLA